MFEFVVRTIRVVADEAVRVGGNVELKRVTAARRFGLPVASARRLS